jgi:hypothetical protein
VNLYQSGEQHDRAVCPVAGVDKDLPAPPLSTMPDLEQRRALGAGSDSMNDSLAYMSNDVVGSSARP